jgi:hypothetical protein
LLEFNLNANIAFQGTPHRQRSLVGTREEETYRRSLVMIKGKNGDD